MNTVLSRPLGYCASQVDSPNTALREKNLLSLSYGNIIQKDIAGSDGLLPESFETYNLVKPGDTVLRLTDLQNDQRSLRVGFVKEQGIITSAYVTLRPHKDVDPRFFSYVLKSMDFRKDFYALGAGVRQSLKFDELKRVQVHLPSLTLQCTIADYLDAETARIDALVERKLRLSDLLEARRVAALWDILSSACPNPTRLKAMVTKVGSGSTPRGGSDVYVEVGVAFLRSQNVRNGRVLHDDVVYITEEEDAAMSGTRVKSGDVLLNITGGSIGRTAVVSAPDLPANVSQHVCILRPVPQVAPQVLQAALDTKFVQDQINLVQVGGNREGLNFDQIRRLEVHVPQTNSYELIPSLEDVSMKHRRALSQIQRQITLLRQRRQALITAAVTGELKISGVAA